MSYFRKQIRSKEEDYDDHSSPESDQPMHGKEDRERLRMAMDEFKKKESKWRKEHQRLQSSYDIITKENENLRLGMYEILNQLRAGEGEDYFD